MMRQVSLFTLKQQWKKKQKQKMTQPQSVRLLKAVTLLLMNYRGGLHRWVKQVTEKQIHAHASKALVRRQWENWEDWKGPLKVKTFRIGQPAQAQLPAW